MDVKTQFEQHNAPQLRIRCGLRAGATIQPSSSGGATINGVYYPDMSGTCAGSTSGGSAIVPSPGGGATIGGVFYPDNSGTCA